MAGWEAEGVEHGSSLLLRAGNIIGPDNEPGGPHWVCGAARRRTCFDVKRYCGFLDGHAPICVPSIWRLVF